jgi:hypothetical protein
MSRGSGILSRILLVTATTITEHADQLKQFQELLALHIQERDRLRKQLAEKPISFRGPRRQLGD